MKGVLSFHPVRLPFFDEIVEPLLAGRKVNPEAFLADAVKLRGRWHRARAWLSALEEILARSEPPRPEPGKGVLKNIRAHLRQLDHREDELTRCLRQTIEPDLHLEGRPFLITEGSATAVAERVDDYLAAPDSEAVDALALEQLVKLDPQLARGVAPVDLPEPSADLPYRSDLLAALKDLHDIARAARRGESWGRAGERRRPAREILSEELAHRGVLAHARAHPFWIGRDVDGLDTVCRAAGVEPPSFMVAPRRLFAAACEEFPDLPEALRVELRGARDVGAFVAPGDVPEMLEFLNVSGSRIIQAAARQGEGPACATLLRKIRECATYAERHGMGYLEASGILPPDLDAEV